MSLQLTANQTLTSVAECQVENGGVWGGRSGIADELVITLKVEN